MVNLRSISLLILWVSSLPGIFPLSAATDTETHMFYPYVRSLYVENPDDFMAPPVIRLNTEDRLLVNFDIIGDSHDYLRYRLIHCNADWQPSRLLDSEVIDGFNEAEITDYAYSSNTFIHYVNYNISLPNDDIRFLAGGNYLLQVYREEDPSDVLLQTRLSVSENVAPIMGEVVSSTDFGFNTEWQQLLLDINLAGLKVDNPYLDIKLEIVQNNNPATSRFVESPQRIEGKHLIYNHHPSLIFKGGNEYRRFETVRTDYAGMHTDSVSFDGHHWHAFLTPDFPRATSQYTYDRTQHGRFKIDEYNASDANLGSDYVTVHFSLVTPEFPGADIYIDGDLTQRSLSEGNRMRYDFNRGEYTASIPLKQGSYNYQYVVVAKGADLSGNTPVLKDASPIEGNFFETSNEYLVKVYYSPPGSRGDRLLGAATLINRP